MVGNRRFNYNREKIPEDETGRSEHPSLSGIGYAKMMNKFSHPNPHKDWQPSDLQHDIHRDREQTLQNIAGREERTPMKKGFVKKNPFAVRMWR